MGGGDEQTFYDVASLILPSQIAPYIMLFCSPPLTVCVYTLTACACRCRCLSVAHTPPSSFPSPSPLHYTTLSFVCSEDVYLEDSGCICRPEAFPVLFLLISPSKNITTRHNKSHCNARQCSTIDASDHIASVLLLLLFPPSLLISPPSLSSFFLFLLFYSFLVDVGQSVLLAAAATCRSAQCGGAVHSVRAQEQTRHHHELSKQLGGFVRLHKGATEREGVRNTLTASNIADPLSFSPSLPAPPLPNSVPLFVSHHSCLQQPV